VLAFQLIHLLWKGHISQNPFRPAERSGGSGTPVLYGLRSNKASAAPNGSVIRERWSPVTYRVQLVEQH
jgi:hypothetical protein